MSRGEPKAGSQWRNCVDSELFYDMRLIVLLVLGLGLLIIRLSGCNFSNSNKSAEYHSSDANNRYVWVSGLNIESGLYNFLDFNPQAGSDNFMAFYDEFSLTPPLSQQKEIISAEFFSVHNSALVNVQGLYFESGRYPEKTTVPARLAPLFFQPVPINRASNEVLCTIPGIGPQLAGRIIELREKRGGVLSPFDIHLVSGIGEAKSSRLKKYISFE